MTMWTKVSVVMQNPWWIDSPSLKGSSNHRYEQLNTYSEMGVAKKSRLLEMSESHHLSPPSTDGVHIPGVSWFPFWDLARTSPYDFELGLPEPVHRKTLNHLPKHSASSSTNFGPYFVENVHSLLYLLKCSVDFRWKIPESDCGNDSSDPLSRQRVVQGHGPSEAYREVYVCLTSWSDNKQHPRSMPSLTIPQIQTSISSVLQE